MNNEWEKIWKFVAVSGTGWIIDVGIYICLIRYMDSTPLYANVISAAVAVTFVFFVSVYKIFLKQRGRYVFVGLSIYLVYQAVSIFLFSYLIDGATQIFIYHHLFLQGISPILAKFIITPITLATNYFFMRLLTAKIMLKKEIEL